MDIKIMKKMSLPDVRSTGDTRPWNPGFKRTLCGRRTERGMTSSASYRLRSGVLREEERDFQLGLHPERA